VQKLPACDADVQSSPNFLPENCCEALQTFVVCRFTYNHLHGRASPSTYSQPLGFSAVALDGLLRLLAEVSFDFAGSGAAEACNVVRPRIGKSLKP